ncbi:MAG: thioredoxin family protein [Spirochaetia bacterium]|nr:thioredoxin family protein [Spirochaetia bacterium]
MKPGSGEWRAPILFYLVLGLIVVSGTTGVVRSAFLYIEGATPVLESLGDLSIHRTYLAARAEAYRNNQILVIVFTAPWSEPCRAFEQSMLENPELHTYLRKVVILRIMDTDPAYRDFSRRADFAALRQGLPFVAVLDSRGNIRLATHDWKSPALIIRALETR